MRSFQTTSSELSSVPCRAIVAPRGAPVRFFRHLCIPDPKRMLRVIFRWRCTLVRRGQAQLSLCNGFMSLLDRYKRLDVWLALPRDRGDASWTTWESSLHESAVIADLAAPRTSIEAWPSFGDRTTRAACDAQLPCVARPGHVA